MTQLKLQGLFNCANLGVLNFKTGNCLLGTCKNRLILMMNKESLLKMKFLEKHISIILIG